MLIHVPGLGKDGIALLLPGDVIFEARGLLLGDTPAERVGMSVLALGLSVTAQPAAMLYATQRGLLGMSGPAWDLLCLHFEPDAALVAARRTATAMLTPKAPPAKVEAPKAPPSPAAAMLPDPYPGLTRHGETWPVYIGRTAADKTTAQANYRAEWAAAGQAHERGEIGPWVASVGAPLGFSWEPNSGEG